MRLNIGSGEFPIEGYVNVDLYPPADVVGDVCELEFGGVEHVVMSHSLEHVSWRKTLPLLTHIHGWMNEGAGIVIEVPDMEEIMRNPDPVWWLAYVYGAQAPHEGETHRAGFTAPILAALLEHAGFREVTTRTFLSEHPYRPGMPCLEATAVA